MTFLKRLWVGRSAKTLNGATHVFWQRPVTVDPLIWLPPVIMDSLLGWFLNKSMSHGPRLLVGLLILAQESCVYNDPRQLSPLLALISNPLFKLSGVTSTSQAGTTPPPEAQFIGPCWSGNCEPAV